MKIAVVLDESYPFGMASANRAHLYSRGLAELGNDVVIFIPRATEHYPLIRNTVREGINDGVRFRYPCQPQIRRSFAGRRVQNLISAINTYLFFIRFNPDIIMFAANNFRYMLRCKLCAFLTGAKLVREKSEVPFYRSENLTSYEILRIKTETKLFDGMIVISESLRKFFHEEFKLNIRILEVPIIIDCNSSGKTANGTTPSQNLVYTGSMLEHKDGISTIIRAFARIRKTHPDMKLIMTGEIREPGERSAISSLIRELELDGNVDLAGYVSKEKLEEIKSTAYALLLAKPGNRQNRYNMATKIGEYLMSGRPAVISSVDPSCSYLRHREDVCIAEPAEEELAGEIEFLLQDSKRADSIGSAGRESAGKLFDYRIHSSRIDIFFKQLLKPVNDQT